MKRLQFSLQTFILLIALLGVLVAWWRDHRDLKHRLEMMHERVRFLESYDVPRSTATPLK